jgi:hypothetical protein
MWTGFIWLRIGTNDGLSLENGNESSDSIKRWEISCLHELLLASQEGICSMELVGWLDFLLRSNPNVPVLPVLMVMFF